MSAIIETLMSVGQALFGLRGELAKVRKERKGAVADFIDAIARTIDQTASSLRIDQYPHGSCAELFEHAQNMSAAIGDLIGTRKADELASQLKEIWEIELLYDELKAETPAVRSRRLSVLDQAAGQFRATAAFIRVSP